MHFVCPMKREDLALSLAVVVISWMHHAAIRFARTRSDSIRSSISDRVWGIDTSEIPFVPASACPTSLRVSAIWMSPIYEWSHLMASVQFNGSLCAYAWVLQALTSPSRHTRRRSLKTVSCRGVTYLRQLKFWQWIEFKGGMVYTLNVYTRVHAAASGKSISCH